VPHPLQALLEASLLAGVEGVLELRALTTKPESSAELAFSGDTGSPPRVSQVKGMGPSSTDDDRFRGLRPPIFGPASTPAPLSLEGARLVGWWDAAWRSSSSRISRRDLDAGAVLGLVSAHGELPN
jgi:hypothetical protein